MSQNFAEIEASLRQKIAQCENTLRAYEQKGQLVDTEMDKLVRARDAINGKIDEQADELFDLQYQLQNVLAQEQRHQNNWVVEREPDPIPPRDQVMPWARGFEEDRRFRRSLAGSVAASLAVAALVGSIAIPLVERSAPPELPERIVKLVLEQQLTPPPAETELAQAEEPEALPLPEPEPQPQPQQEQRKPEPIERPPAAADKPLLAQAPQPAPAKPKGILAFRERIASKADSRPAVALGTQAKLTSAGADATGRTQRSMVTSSAPGSSGGINLAAISRDVGGGGGGAGGTAIQGVQAGRVASSIGGSGGRSRPVSGGGSSGRSDEEIQIVFDRNKAALYRLYNRELRKNPTLRGQLVLRLTIEADGSVSMCRLQGSDMDAPALAQQIVDRVLRFDFGAKSDIVAMTIIYPIDFLPAA